MNGTGDWEIKQRTSRGPLSRRRLSKKRLTQASGIALLVVLCLTTLGPFLLSRYMGLWPDAQDLAHRMEGPSGVHPLGTDMLGRDLLIRLLEGTRVSLLVGLVGAVISFLIGVSYGAIAGYYGGRIDEAMMRVVDCLYALPSIVIIVVLFAVFPGGLFLLCLALGSISWFTIARVARGQVLSVKNEPFVDSARAIGCSNTRILFRHLIPNIIGPVITYATLTVPSVILSEAFLSFLGLGVQPPTASWGVLMSEGIQAMSARPLLVAAPGGMMVLTLMTINILGDGLRDMLNPHVT